MSYPGSGQYGPQPNDGGGYQPETASVYGGLGTFGEPPKRSRTPLVVAVVTALVAVAAGIGVYFAVADGEGDKDDPSPNQAGPPASEASETGTTSVPDPTSPTTTGETSVGDVAPVVPDWQVVVSEKHGAAFDVSKDWTINSPTYVIGYEDDVGLIRVAMQGTGSYRKDHCAGARMSARAIAGFQYVDDADPAKAPPIAAKEWATAVVDLPADSGKVNPSQALKVQIKGGQDAWLATATAPSQPENACDPELVRVTAVAFRPRSGSDQVALFILVEDRKVGDALPDDEGAKVIGSLRAIND